MVVNPSAEHVGAVVDSVGAGWVASITELVNEAEAAEVQPPLVAVTV